MSFPKTLSLLLQANVRNCLSNKVDFVKDCSRKSRSYWSLSPQVKAKLKPHDCYDFTPVKENVTPLKGSTEKYVLIAPKVHYSSSYSQDCFTRGTDNQSTPLRQFSENTINRQCHSEDKNLFRHTGTALKRGPDLDDDLIGAPRKKLFCEQSPSSESTSKKSMIRVEPNESGQVRIHCNSISFRDDNAVFDESCCTSNEMEMTSLTQFTKSTIKPDSDAILSSNPENSTLDMAEIIKRKKAEDAGINIVPKSETDYLNAFDSASDSFGSKSDNTVEVKDEVEIKDVFDELSQDSFGGSSSFFNELSSDVNFSLLDDLPDFDYSP